MFHSRLGISVKDAQVETQNVLGIELDGGEVYPAFSDMPSGIGEEGEDEEDGIDLT